MRYIEVKNRVFKLPIIGIDGLFKFLNEILEICGLEDFQERSFHFLEMIIRQDHDVLISEISETSNMHYVQAKVVVIRLILILEICLIAGTETKQEQSYLIESLIDQLSVLVRTDKLQISLDDLNGYLNSEGINVSVVKKTVYESESDRQITILVLRRKILSQLAFEGESAFPVHGVCKN
ncbi:hypothetical protein [Maribellus sediminis]|uniref:hypothetical protein n=1 Tax=Maribellus sediminis TaxID=2696285 RepID=UPI0014305562|nr:hypothetical protein [Maribellus sediminis]